MTEPSEKSTRRADSASRRSGPPPSEAEAASPAPAARDDARVAKVMSRAGLCSRRDAEAWIKAGRVAINGTVIDTPAINVGPEDSITVDGSPIDKAERTRLFMFHKPRGLVTTAKDPEGRPTIYDALSTELPRLITVGRLDINTEGLLLLTNDGGLARMLELPSTGWMRRYRVRANGATDQATLDGLAAGLTIDGVDYAGIEAKLDRVQGANVWLTMGLREGKNREIKRVLEHLGLSVNRLIRLSFGPFQLGDLGEGTVEEVPTRVLRDQLGPALAREAGVDFEGPVTAAVVTREVRQSMADERRAKKQQGGKAVQGGREPREGSHPRQHVSSLRAARQQDAEGPRRRLERGATEDRNGRAVTVERITVSKRAPRSAPLSRNARRFEQAKADDAPASRRGASPSGAGEGREAERPDGRRPRTLRQADRDKPAAGAPRTRDEGRREGRGERPRFERDEASAARPPRGGDRDGGFAGKPRAPRSEGAAVRSARPEGDKRSSRGKPFDSASKDSRSRPERGGDRPRNGAGAKGFGKRPGPGGGGGRGPRPGGGRGRPAG